MKRKAGLPDARADVFLQRCMDSGCPPDLGFGPCRYISCRPCWLAWARRRQAQALAAPRPTLPAKARLAMTRRTR